MPEEKWLPSPPRISARISPSRSRSRTIFHGDIRKGIADDPIALKILPVKHLYVFEEGGRDAKMETFESGPLEQVLCQPLRSSKVTGALCVGWPHGHYNEAVQPCCAAR